MPESLKDSDTGGLLQDRIDSVESAISDLESITFDEDDEELDEDHYSELIQDALNNIDV